MREIKFRAWMIAGKYMKQWEDLEHINIWAYFNHGGILIPMQYTGLKDKNGKEIYEGDIVHSFMQANQGNWVDFDHVCQVIFDVKTCAFMAQDGGLDLFFLTNTELYEVLDLEIIGNIYENPELLK